MRKKDAKKTKKQTIESLPCNPNGFLNKNKLSSGPLFTVIMKYVIQVSNIKFNNITINI